MVNSLTSKQKLVLATISDLTQKNGNPPTLEELRKFLDYPQISSVQRHTDALKKKGYLDPGRGLGLRLRSDEVKVPLVGNVACGTPLLAEENIEAYIPYPKDKLPGGTEQYFFLRAVGDSMDKAGIDDGDFVLIKQQPSADYGQRIVALIGDEATIKQYQVKDGHIVLQPETTNSQNKPIILFDDFTIQGVVKDVIKGGGKNGKS